LQVPQLCAEVVTDPAYLRQQLVEDIEELQRDAAR